MKFFLTVSLFLLSLTVSAQGLEGSVSQVDFGKISKVTVKNYTVYNRSSQPIVIISATTDCNCTKVAYSPRPIKGGDSTILKVTYSPKDKGAFYKSVTIKNSSNKDLKFIVRGSVI